MCVLVFNASLLNYLGGLSAKVGSSAKFGVVVFKASILNSWGVYISQSRFACQVWCSSIQGIYSRFTGGPSAKVCSTAKFCVPVFKASLLCYLGGPLAKEGSSAKFGVVVFKASILNSWGGPLAKEGSSAKYELTSKFTLALQRSFGITYKDQ